MTIKLRDRYYLHMLSIQIFFYELSASKSIPTRTIFFKFKAFKLQKKNVAGRPYSSPTLCKLQEFSRLISFFKIKVDTANLIITFTITFFPIVVTKKEIPI